MFTLSLFPDPLRVKIHTEPLLSQIHTCHLLNQFRGHLESDIEWERL